MTKEITAIMVHLLSQYPELDHMAVYLWAVELYMKEHRGDVINEIEIYKFVNNE